MIRPLEDSRNVKTKALLGVDYWEISKPQLIASGKWIGSCHFCSLEKCGRIGFRLQTSLLLQLKKKATTFFQKMYIIVAVQVHVVVQENYGKLIVNKNMSKDLRATKGTQSSLVGTIWFISSRSEAGISTLGIQKAQKNDFGVRSRRSHDDYVCCGNRRKPCRCTVAVDCWSKERGDGLPMFYKAGVCANILSWR